MRGSLYDFLLGVFVFGAIIGLGVLLAKYVANPIGDYYHLNVIFDDVTGLSKGSTVYLKGYRVGYVENIEIKNINGKIWAFVKLNINSNVKIPKNATFMLSQSGLMGDKSINILVDKIDNEKGFFTEKDIIKAKAAYTWDKLVSDGKEIAENIKKVTESLKEVMQEKKLEEIRKTLNDTIASWGKVADKLKNSIGDLSGDFKDLVNSMNEEFASISTELKNQVSLTGGNIRKNLTSISNKLKKVMEEYKKLATNFGKTSTDLRKTINKVGGTVDKSFNQVSDKLNKSLDELRKFLEKLNADYSTKEIIAAKKGAKRLVKNVAKVGNIKIERTSWIGKEGDTGSELFVNNIYGNFGVAGFFFDTDDYLKRGGFVTYRFLGAGIMEGYPAGLIKYNLTDKINLLGLYGKVDRDWYMLRMKYNLDDHFRIILYTEKQLGKKRHSGAAVGYEF